MTRYSPTPKICINLENPVPFKAQDRRCYLCGFKMKRGLTRDHVWPRALGGRDAGNIILAHANCNWIKSNRAPTPCELLYRDAIYLRVATAMEIAA